MLKFTDFDSLWSKSLKCLCSSRRCVGRFKRFEVLEVNQHPPFWKIVVLNPVGNIKYIFPKGKSMNWIVAVLRRQRGKQWAKPNNIQNVSKYLNIF